MLKTHYLGLIEEDYMNENKFTENYPKHEYSFIYKTLFCTNPTPTSD